MTQEQFEKLKPWEKVLNNAVRCDFIHLSATEFNKIAEIYEEVLGEKLTVRQRNCNTCRLNALKKLGAEFIAYRDRDQKPKRKAGRPKKIQDA